VLRYSPQGLLDIYFVIDRSARGLVFEYAYRQKKDHLCNDAQYCPLQPHFPQLSSTKARTTNAHDFHKGLKALLIDFGRYVLRRYSLFGISDLILNFLTSPVSNHATSIFNVTNSVIKNLFRAVGILCPWSLVNYHCRIISSTRRGPRK